MAISDKLTQITNNVPLVYGAGYDEGYEKGLAEGGGGDNYYDTFWDAYQPQSGYKAWAYKYAGASWNDKTLTPKYSDRPTGTADNMFRSNACKNIKQAYASKGNVLDISGCTSAQSMFSGSITRELGILDVSNLTGANSMVEMVAYCGSLTTIEKVISSKDTYYANSTFASNKLANILFEGEIGKSISFASCTALTSESITSIINCLSTTTTGLTVTLSLTAVNNAFEGGRDGTEWQTLIGLKSNWEFAYA